MDVSTELGGITTITVAVIIITGVFGNIVGEPICKLFHITEPVAKGVGMGSSAHAIGTAKAMEMGEVEGAISSLSNCYCRFHCRKSILNYRQHRNLSLCAAIFILA